MTRPGIDAVASDILGCLIDRGGSWDAEPGQLLKELAECTGRTYAQVRVAVRYLEEIEFVAVERLTDPSPRQHNLVCRIAVV